MKKIVGFIGCLLVVAFMIICKVCVDNANDREKNVQVTVNSKRMAVGDSYTIKYKDLPEDAEVSFSSSDKKVAKVKSKGRKVNDGKLKKFGKIEAVGPGNAVITVTMKYDDRELTESLEVIVSEALTEEE